MRLAFVSPLPPSKSGIADYAAALLEPLGRLASVEVFTEKTANFDAARFDFTIYQIGNNTFHAFAYETALEHPGVVVLHEPNLHHLIAEITIRSGDWDAYLREAEYNGGDPALERARRVQRLEVGPDYEGLPMTRRLIERARAIIVHSGYAAEQVRTQGFRGPIARIPHGAWIPDADRMAYRTRLGLDEAVPLVGVFGFLKPYKRIAESLRAFRRVVKLEPRARMILAGEPHPELPLGSLIASLGLSAYTRVLGFVPIEDFTGYLAACDVVFNLRYPTVGESSGTLLRSLGLGKAVLVSETGAFSELPDDVCLKVPVDAAEEELIFEYLNLLVSRPELARELGARARRWVERECNWELAARRYVSFLCALKEGREWDGAALQPPVEPPAGVTVQAEYVLGWATTSEAREYARTHIDRLERTLQITPPGGPGDRVLEMGAYLQITPALKTRLGYEEVRGCYYGPAGRTHRKAVTSAEGERFECDIDLFDAERDSFPYPDGHFATVLCCELIEHLAADPMHMLSEINRVLRPGGHLVMTTPNIASLRAISAILQGFHPGFFPPYIRPKSAPVEARHNREYTSKEIYRLLSDAGFTVVRLETGPFREAPRPELLWVARLLEQWQLPADQRGEGIFAVACRSGPVRDRYPEWLYSGGE